MALDPVNSVHAKQIRAGIKGRKQGHKFEQILANVLNTLSLADQSLGENISSHVYRGNPAKILLAYVLSKDHIDPSCTFKAYWLGGLATANHGDKIVNGGKKVSKSKSDVLLVFTRPKDGFKTTIGVSVKKCTKRTPTNDQMYFTTAHGFCTLLRNNGIEVRQEAEAALSKFCGDKGFRPIDLMQPAELAKRLSDHERYYWEEIEPTERTALEQLMSEFQDDITRILFQLAYSDDPFRPEFLIHQTVGSESFDATEIAAFTIDEIVELSHAHCGFVLSPYQIRKGSHKNDPATHYAPRIGFIQMQRGGQKQHPTQLQFNLKAGYFRHLSDLAI